MVDSLGQKTIEVFKLTVDRDTQRLKRASGGMDPPFFIRSDGAYKVRKDAHDQALSFLKDVASGRAGLDVPTAEETIETPASPDEVLRGSAETSEVFSKDKLSSF